MKTNLQVTLREQQALQLIANGMSHKSTARAMHLSESRITRLLRRAGDKLGGANTTHTVATAWHNKIIV
jgi:DNA-binding CsgD family transcriptional regulator